MKIRIFFQLSLIILISSLVFLSSASSMTVSAKSEDRIPDGIYADHISLGGMTRDEADKAVNEYVDSLRNRSYTLTTNQGDSYTLTGSQLGITLANPTLVDDAFSLAHTGNMVVRFKARSDLKRETKNFHMDIICDRATLSASLTGIAVNYNVESKNGSLVPGSNGFEFKPGTPGREIDIPSSATKIVEAVKNSSSPIIPLVCTVKEPKGSSEELSQVKDVLGTFSTDYSSSSAKRMKNVENGIKFLNGITLYPGETLSALKLVTPFTEEMGYAMAPSYAGGKVVDSLGGGICQVTTTLYNAALRAELGISERHSHSMNVSYVKLSMDAAITETSGKDLKITNNQQYPIYIEGKAKDKKVTFTIYGKETRDTLNRKIVFENETIETIEPAGNDLVVDSDKKLGYVSLSNSHTGYKTCLWKIYYEGDNEIKKEKVNDSKYNATPGTLTVGVAGASESDIETLRASIELGDVNNIKQTAAALAAAHTQSEAENTSD